MASFIPEWPQPIKKQGQLAEAERAWHAALRADANNPMALNNLAFLYAEQRKQLDQALAWAKKAVGVSRQAEHLDTLAWVHRARGEKAQALALLENASATSRNATLLYHLGIVLRIRP